MSLDTTLKLLAIALLIAAPAAILAIAAGPARDDRTTNPLEELGMVNVHVFNADGELVGPVPMPRVERTEDDWRRRLSPEQFRILRKDGTEPAFCGTLLDNKKQGVYSCAGCSLPLFSSDSKFKSGTGWPSFFQPIAPTNVIETIDRSHGMVRTEITCARCDGHLGHVFPDGPPPTGRRFCLNSESLTFTESTELASLGEYATAVVAGGCFWCVEAVFEELEGVHEVISGYAGGRGSPDYKSVMTGTTGHAEAVQIIYDPRKIDFPTLLQVHFATHDPTTLNRQGADIGPQYRSAIFYASEEEKAIAEAMIEDLNDANIYDRPIVTTLEPLTQFHVAETYHQNYVCNNPSAGYVRGVAMPKVEKVRKKFADRLKDKSPLDQDASDPSSDPASEKIKTGG